MILWSQLTSQVTGTTSPVLFGFDIEKMKFWTYVLNCVNPKNLKDGIKYELFQFNIPRGNGTVYENNNYRQTEFPMSILISESTPALFEEKVDELYEKVHGEVEFLYYKKSNGEIRKISCIGDVKGEKEDHYNITWQVFTITFKTYGDFWHTTEPQSYAGNFTADGSGFISNNGNVESRVKTYVIVNSESGLSSVNLTIAGVSCVYTGALNAGDVLLFDGESNKLLLNNVPVDYSGGTPQHEVAPWSNAFSIDCNGTFNIDIIMLYNQNYKNA